MPRVYGGDNPIIRYAPYAVGAARRVFGAAAIRPIERAFLNAGPGLGLAAAKTIWDTYRAYQDSANAVSSLYEKSDYLYQPEKTGTDTAVEAPGKRPRISLLGGRGHTGGNAPSSSAAVQSTEYREQLPDAPSASSSSLVRHVGGSTSDTAMVRRIYAGRRISGRRRRFPGSVFRRSFRGGWSSLSRFSSRRRLYKPERKAYSIDWGTPDRAGGIFFQAEINIKPSSGVNAPLVTNSANGLSLVEIAQGTHIYSRIGSQITVTNIMIRGCIKTPTTAGDTPAYNNCVTVYVVQDRQSNGAIPTTGQLLTVGTYTDPSTTMRNLANRSRFRILAKRQMILIGGTNANTYYYEISIKKPIKVTYDGDGGTYNEIKTNNIWLFCFDNRNYVTSDPITNLAYHESLFIRTRFIDP